MEIRQLTSEEQRLLEKTKTFARNHVTPLAAQWENDRRVPVESYRVAAELGLTAVMIPPDLGGMGASHIATAKILEEIAAGCMAFAMGLWVQNNVANSIVRNGTPDQIDKFLPRMLKGECIGAFCLTEPHAGSDAAAIVTRAEKNGSEWEVRGEKAWVVHGPVANVFCVYAQTDPNAGWRGIAAFLVEDATPGIERGDSFPLMGCHALGSNSVTFDKVRVPEENLLVKPGEGFKAALVGINKARTFIAAKCCGILADSLRIALNYASKRKAFHQPVLDFQGLQWELADVATNLEAARCLTYHAANALDRGEAAILESAHAKKFASQAALTGISACMEAMGAAGFRTDYPLVRHLASAKMSKYLDGTTGIHNVIIGRSLLESYGGEG